MESYVQLKGMLGYTRMFGVLDGQHLSFYEKLGTTSPSGLKKVFLVKNGNVEKLNTGPSG